MHRSDVASVPDVIDLLVCGGGVYGSWVAYDAALRGMSVLLVEQSDWASGSSSASTKLIHGGLRYLQTLDFSVVKKSLKERHWLLSHATHRVWPLRFCIPVYSHSEISQLQYRMGLWLYDLMAKVAMTSDGHALYDKDQVSAMFSCLRMNELKYACSYLDAQTDDARYVLELVDGAVNAGARVMNYCHLNAVDNAESGLKIVSLYDQITAETRSLNCRAVVKCQGNWTSQSVLKSAFYLSKGVHLVMPKIMHQQALLLNSPIDGRVFFLIPWYEKTLLGTTDTHFTEDVDQLAVTAEDKQYLLDSVNAYLRKKWTLRDIQGQFAGLRVLDGEAAGHSPSQSSREWHLEQSEAGIFYSIGGKLTSARQDAVSIVNKVQVFLNRRQPTCMLDQPFPWSVSEMQKQALLIKACELDLDESVVTWLFRRHGCNAAKVLELLEQNPELKQRIESTVPVIYADLVYCLKHEMVFHLDDVLRRRIPLLILCQMPKADLIRLAEYCADWLNWDQNRLKQEIQVCFRRYKQDNA